MLVVGLTGGIGSGKTTVATLFAKLGVPVIDTDELARELSQREGAAFSAILNLFGKDVLTPSGDLDRRKLREIVFVDATKRKALEDILHPMIREKMAERIQAVNYPYCIVVIPLLLEKPTNPLINRILVVDTLEELQISRAQARDQSDTDTIKAIMQAQASRAHRIEKADDIIVNDKKIEDLEEQVKKLHNIYLSLP